MSQCGMEFIIVAGWGFLLYLAEGHDKLTMLSTVFLCATMFHCIKMSFFLLFIL